MMNIIPHSNKANYSEMSYELEGILHKVFPTETRSENFKTRDFVVLVPGEYPQHIKFQLSNDRCSIIDKIPEGMGIKVFFNLKGREWEGKYFTNAVAWRVESMTGSTSGTLDKEVKVVSDDISDAVVLDGDGDPVPL